MIKKIKIAFFSLLSFAMVSSAYADITFVCRGGAYTAAQQKGFINNWNGKVNVENYNGGLGEIKAQLESKMLHGMLLTFYLTKEVQDVTKGYLLN